MFRALKKNFDKKEQVFSERGVHHQKTARVLTRYIGANKETTHVFSGKNLIVTVPSKALASTLFLETQNIKNALAKEGIMIERIIVR